MEGDVAQHVAFIRERASKQANEPAFQWSQSAFARGTADSAYFVTL